jgi:hypothetical protein
MEETRKSVRKLTQQHNQPKLYQRETYLYSHLQFG